MLKFGRNLSDERGATNPFMIATIIFAVLTIGFGVAFGWAFMQMTDYRDNVNSKINAAVEEARKVQQELDEKQFDEDYKKPNLTFEGPSDSGSVRFEYPKTWSVYLAKDGRGGSELSAYFYPKTVPTVNNATIYALRVSIVEKSYDQVLKSYEARIKKGDLSAKPITVGKTDDFAGNNGTRIDGQFDKVINGSVVIFKIRDKTLQLFVDSQDFMDDFNNTILPSLRYEI